MQGGTHREEPPLHFVTTTRVRAPSESVCGSSLGGGGLCWGRGHASITCWDIGEAIHRETAHPGTCSACSLGWWTPLGVPQCSLLHPQEQSKKSIPEPRREAPIFSCWAPPRPVAVTGKLNIIRMRYHTYGDVGYTFCHITL